ncbi:MAG: sigma-54-dependent Fis family transcriptional regulator [Candidatus Makaraimicrobium thalassicum]|nr:MAG: sigma-54-dependent Fis family transcriptional regulator [Candidatus Omnitrophota bacterium]
MSEGNILIVDDEETMCNLLKDILAEKGYEVTTTQKAREALELAQDRPFDLIITDLKMPEIDGIEMVRQIKEFGIDSIVLVITAYPSVESVRDVLGLGAYDYITKPFNLEEMFFTVKRAVEFHQLNVTNKKLIEKLEKQNILLEGKKRKAEKDIGKDEGGNRG